MASSTILTQFLETQHKDKPSARPCPKHTRERWKKLGTGGRIYYQEMALA